MYAGDPMFFLDVINVIKVININHSVNFFSKRQLFFKASTFFKASSFIQCVRFWDMRVQFSTSGPTGGPRSEELVGCLGLCPGCVSRLNV